MTDSEGSMKPQLTIEAVIKEAGIFTEIESKHNEAILYGTTDGKAVGTYIEQKFRRYLLEKYEFKQGNSAKGIDFPELNLELKMTSIKQPQSSCPFKSGRQKIFGLGYSIILFVYDKKDDPSNRTANLNFLHTIYIHETKTADFQITRGLRQILENDGNRDDILSYISDKNLPIDDIEANAIADDLLISKPEQGYLTISNALQWRLQYNRVIQVAGTVAGIDKLR
jgi:hypothetical protein